MNPKKYKLSFTFDVVASDIPEDLLRDITQILSSDEYSDGRRNFFIELIGDAAARRLKDCIGRAVVSNEHTKHGNKMVAVGKNHKTSKALLEADKRLKDMQILWVGLRDGTFSKKVE